MKPQRPIFLARHGYRRRRVMDAARALPILGAFLFFIPLLWSDGQGGYSETRTGTVYLFVIWALLIAGAGWLSRYLKDQSDQTAEPNDEERRE